jgi:ABC-type glycerol-3-phosphate transport system substrate-binding protein
MNKKLIPLFLILVFLLTSGATCQGPSQNSLQYMQPVSLNYWRVWDGPDDFKEIIDAYKVLHPFITINYRKLRYDEYEQALIEAFAEDRGPDIFSIQNTWTRKYQSKGLIEPMPDTITLSYPFTEGRIKKETNPGVKTTRSISLKNIKDNFVDVVYDDVVIGAKDPTTNTMANKVYGLPLFTDTLALFYNKDLLNNASISNPPSLWNSEFQQDVKKLSKQDAKGQIIQTGVALGGSKNVERASDILSVLMMQNGTQMMDGTRVTFNQKPVAFDKDIVPGVDALRFYSDFANPAKEVYCWNSEMDDSLNLFMQGKLAMMFGYSYMLPQIKAGAPKLNFSIAPLPQIENNPPVNFANYWVEAVSSKIKTNPENLAKGQFYTKLKTDTAWDFVQFAASADHVKSYLTSTNRVTALRKLIDSETDNPQIGEFAKQALTAKSWYKGVDANAAEAIINGMIDSAVAGKGTIEDAINLGAQKVQQTISVNQAN